MLQRRPSAAGAKPPPVTNGSASSSRASLERRVSIESAGSSGSRRPSRERRGSRGPFGSRRLHGMPTFNGQPDMIRGTTQSGIGQCEYARPYYNHEGEPIESDSPRRDSIKHAMTPTDWHRLSSRERFQIGMHSYKVADGMSCAAVRRGLQKEKVSASCPDLHVPPAADAKQRMLHGNTGIITAPEPSISDNQCFLVAVKARRPSKSGSEWFPKQEQLFLDNSELARLQATPRREASTGSRNARSLSREPAVPRSARSQRMHNLSSELFDTPRMLQPSSISPKREIREDSHLDFLRCDSARDTYRSPRRDTSSRATSVDWTPRTENSEAPSFQDATPRCHQRSSPSAPGKPVTLWGEPKVEEVGENRRRHEKNYSDLFGRPSPTKFIGNLPRSDATQLTSSYCWHDVRTELARRSEQCHNARTQKSPESKGPQGTNAAKEAPIKQQCLSESRKQKVESARSHVFGEEPLRPSHGGAQQGPIVVITDCRGGRACTTAQRTPQRTPPQSVRGSLGYGTRNEVASSHHCSAVARQRRWRQFSSDRTALFGGEEL